jgi:hypothetical protein
MTKQFRSTKPAKAASQANEPMTEARLHSIIKRNFGDVRLPPPSHFVLAAAAIQNYRRRPWSNSDAARLTHAARKMKQERQTLDAAAKILRADASRFFKGNEDFQRRYGEAIQMLQMPRGSTDNPRDHVAKISDQGNSGTGWAYITREILGWIVPILKQNNIDISSRRSSPLVKSLREILGFIYPGEKIPACTTISRVVDKYLYD